MECTHCGKPTTAGITLCAEDARNFTELIQQTPDRLLTITTTVTKQAVITTGRQSKQVNGAVALPYNANASDRKLALRAALSNLALRVLSNIPSKTADVAASVVANMNYIQSHNDAGEWYYEYREAFAGTTRAIDLPPERVRVGRCECGLDLYAVGGRGKAYCRTCELEWDVQELKDYAINQAENLHRPPAELSRWLTISGYPTTTKQFMKWVERNKIAPAYEIDGVKQYRLGDAFTLAKDEKEKRRERSAS